MRVESWIFALLRGRERLVATLKREEVETQVNVSDIGRAFMPIEGVTYSVVFTRPVAPSVDQEWLAEQW